MLAALLTLTVGIGANVTIFSLVNGLSLRPMPFGDRTDRLVTIHPTHRLNNEQPGWGEAEISYKDLLDFRTSPSVDGISAYVLRNFVLSGDASSAERVLGGSVSPNLFPMLGIEPMMGRQFRDEEATAPGLESVVIITHGLWQRRYGSDPAIVGKTIMVNDRAREVIGVLPPGFKFPLTDQLYMPFRWDEAPRDSRNVNAVALLKHGVTIAQFQSELSSIAKRLEQQYPITNNGYGVQVIPIRRSYVGANVDRMGIVLMTAVGFVLLIMCANLANLMLVRGAARQRELAVRAAMGAGSGRLLWVAISESVLLAVPGTIAGVIASQWAIDWMIASFPEPGTLPYWFTFGIDWRVALFTIGVAIFTTLAVGLLPSIRAAKPDLVNDLKEAGRGLSLGRAGQRLQAALAVAQVALCFGLLIGANLMVRSFMAMQSADLGFDDRPIVSARGYLAGDRFNDVKARAEFYQSVVTTLKQLPAVSAAVVTMSIPGDDGGADRHLVTDGRTTEADEINVQSVSVTPGLFDTIDQRIIEGRDFTGEEATNPEANVALINQALANRLWPGQSPIDRRVGFRFGDDIQWMRVVGVAPNVHYEEVGEESDQSRLNVYVPYAMDPARSMAMLVRTQASPDALLTPMRDALGRIGPTFPIYRLMPMRELRKFTSWEDEYFGDLMASFATAAMLLACLGIYALISYTVGRRSREIGIRLALGARPADVVAMLLQETVKVGGTGLVAGLTLGVVIARTLAASLYGVRVDVWLFATMAAPLALAILLATWLPARRAARVEPTIALRDE